MHKGECRTNQKSQTCSLNYSLKQSENIEIRAHFLYNAFMSDFRTAYVFSDGCVLQRKKNISVFGVGSEGSIVTVTLNGTTVCTVVSDGKWKAVLPPMEAAENLTMEIKSGDKVITYKDVAIGEVWLAGGQSNMELTLPQIIDGEKMLETEHPKVRFYYTPKFQYEGEELSRLARESRWEYFEGEGARKWSAIGYLFAKQLSETLGVTVGVIGCNWGGTSASAWMPECDLENAWPDVRSYIEEYRAGIEGKSLEQQKAEYDEYLAYRAVWEPKCEALYAENPNIEWSTVLELLGSDRYPGPINSFSPHRPSGLYHTMLSKVIEYTLAGVIYYQGESDDHKPRSYYNLFNKLVERWRRDNGDMKLPFLAVSLPMHRFRTDPDFKNWPIIRKAQRKVALDNRMMGIAVAIDCGEKDNIHPREKRVVAGRLALQALNLVYGKISEKEANGPIVYAVEYKPDGCYLRAKYSEDGYFVKGEKITGFEIAPFRRGGAREEDYVEAEAELLPDNRIRVYSDLVTNPGSVRYLWTNWGEVTLYGANGIPLEPFGA